MVALDSTLMALLAQKCPRCHQGNLFTHTAYNLTKFTDMPSGCPVCNFQYEPEPGFYWGAMYISYAFSTGIVIIVGVILYNFFGDPDTWVYVTTVALATLLFTPVLLRYSRTVMLYFFGGTRYDPTAATEHSSSDKMNIEELKRLLKQYKVNRALYEFDKEYPDGSYCIRFNGHHWETYYSEKGEKFVLNLYDNEADACDAFFNQVFADKRS